ncbi:rhodanese-like domain-containing protein [Moraxella sp. ZY210820]|uniref:rhodanese-like domain-containing protein n=1 Tax=unclassified Moraxella TaxID=2685852 RepID=UPI002730C84C|nr:rhodanese-like domain-containing protein [Moraxella sp. ZY210820]WLF83868.1 rhodanese-like domain-containing protein [Moraxella sp. ZY210820]
MKVLLLTPIIVLGLMACTDKSQVNSQPAMVQQPVQSTQQAEKGIWIDVRTADEFNRGHLAHAVNIAHGDIAEKIATVEPNKNAPIHLYCQSGRRAEIARKTLLEMGYTNVINHGAYDDLKKQQP